MLPFCSKNFGIRVPNRHICKFSVSCSSSLCPLARCTFSFYSRNNSNNFPKGLSKTTRKSLNRRPRFELSISRTQSSSSHIGLSTASKRYVCKSLCDTNSLALLPMQKYKHTSRKRNSKSGYLNKFDNGYWPLFEQYGEQERWRLAVKRII